MIEYSDSTAFDATYGNISLIEFRDITLGGSWDTPANLPHKQLANRTKWLKALEDNNDSTFNDATSLIIVNTTNISNYQTRIGNVQSDTTTLLDDYETNFIYGFNNFIHYGTDIYIRSGKCRGFGVTGGTNDGKYTLIDSTIDDIGDVNILELDTNSSPGGLGSHDAEYNDWTTGDYYIFILKATDGAIDVIASKTYTEPDLSGIATKWLNGYYRRIGSFIRVTSGLYHGHSGALFYEAIGEGLDRTVIFDEKNYMDGANFALGPQYINIQHNLSNIIYVPKYTVKYANIYYQYRHNSTQLTIGPSAPGNLPPGDLFVRPANCTIGWANCRIVGKSDCAGFFDIAIDDPDSDDDSYYKFYAHIDRVNPLISHKLYWISFYCNGYTETLNTNL